jgi:hypothetical protein
MKKLTSKFFKMLYTISGIAIIPLAVIECYEIISGRAAVDPHIRNLTEGLFWSAFAVYYICQLYMNKHKDIIEA